MTAALVKLLRVASIVICVIVAASFLVFAVQQTKSASNHQQASLTGTGTSSGEPSTRNEGSIHKALDEVSSELTSPFAGIVTGSSEWATRGIRMLAALVVYGFGLGYLARVLRVRV